MALDLSTLQDYTNEHGAKMVNKLIAQGQTFKWVTIQPGIKSAEKINLISTSLSVVAGSCGWSAAGSGNTGQATLTVNPYKVQFPMCIADAEKKSLQYDVRAGSSGDDVPFALNWIEEASADLRLYNENYFWSNSTYGILKYLSTNSGSTNNIAYTGTAVTESNAVTIVDALKKKVPSAMKMKELILFIGTDFFDLFIINLKNLNLFHIDPTGTYNPAEYTYKYLGITIVGTVGLDSTDKALLTVRDNIYLGTDLLDENDKFDVWYSRDNNEIRLAAYWKIGQTCLYPNLCVVKH